MLNLVSRTTPYFLQVALDHVAACGGFVESVFTDSNLGTKAILIGEGPACRDEAWAARLRNSEESLNMLADIWVRDVVVKRDGSRRKRDAKEAGELAVYAAFACHLLGHLKDSGSYEETHLGELRERILQQPGRPATSPIALLVCALSRALQSLLACTLHGEPCRQPDIKSQIEEVCKEKEKDFSWLSLPFVCAVPKKETRLQKEAAEASALVDKQIEEVVSVVELKLKHDQASFRLYLSRLAEEVDRSKSALRAKKLQARRMGEAAAQAFTSKHLAFCAIPNCEAHAIISHHTTALQLLETGLTTSTVVILDANCTEAHQLTAMVGAAMLLLNRDPQRNALLVLYPWSRDRNTGHEIRPGKRSACSCAHACLWALSYQFFRDLCSRASLTRVLLWQRSAKWPTWTGPSRSTFRRLAGGQGTTDHCPGGAC